MANPITCYKFLSLLIISIAVIFSCVVNGGDARQTPTFHNIKASSFLPDSSVCDETSKDAGKLSSSSLRVVHRYGPCHKSKKTETPSVSEILTQDELRVKSINSRIASDSARGAFGSSKSVKFPAKSGVSFGTLNYIITVGLGTPKKDLTLIFDTGSDLMWTQCKPCRFSCHNQKEAIFDPSLSSSYKNISCNTAACNQLSSSICREDTCIYGIGYGDQSFSTGYFAKDTLTLSSRDVIRDFYFGCGQDNEGIGFGETGGLIGLARDKLSFVSQTSEIYGEVFSYCLPSQSSGTGYLSLGKSGISNTVKYTPFSSTQGKSFYFIDILEICVGGQKLPISRTVFSTAGSIIDSGTVITRLPPAAYTALRDSFRQKMSKYTLGQPAKLLDTCYDFRKYETVRIPTISFLFGGNNKVDIDATGILIGVSPSQICLAFAPNRNAADVAIFGNVQQKTMQVVYDVAGGKLGFGKNGCA